ncbi:FtsX-like permease family protein [Lentzea aerocolonigenes]|uniref:FtsX-like permease family protein n=1 Tax=Lentzea aerocolonigenes TaxID=68170 RepID=UPI0006976A31|nr:FtsX-like permease family protein [Lentzea aerocolonigenes]
MRSLLIGQLAHRRGRTLALFLGILVATTGFTLLTGSTTTSRLQTVGAVDANYRAAYDILVRPKGSRTQLEVERGLVRPNYLSGLYGGISLGQYEQIKKITGVDVAAPIAMVGYTSTNLRAAVDATDAVDRSQATQTVRLKPRWTADRGLTRLDDDATHLAYVTKRVIAWPAWDASGRFKGYDDGKDHSAQVAVCGPGARVDPVEIQDDGTGRALCHADGAGPGATGLDARDRQRLVIARLLPDGSFDRGPTFPTGEHRVSPRLTVDFEWPMSLLLAGIDPEQEAALVGLDKSVVSGRYLRGDETTARDGFRGMSIPVVVPERPALDEQLVVTTEQVPGQGIAGVNAQSAYDSARSAAGTLAGESRMDATDVYGAAVRDELRAQLSVVVQAGSPNYDQQPDGSLRPRDIDVNLNAVWGNNTVDGFAVPWFAKDMANRPLTKFNPGKPGGELLSATAAGVFDATKLRGFSELSAVPLETYHPPKAVAADEASKRELGDKPLVPNSNPGGYLASPPMMLTSLSALPALLEGTPQANAPISSVRVQVAGITGMDAVSQERVRLAAEQITVATGLDVDITIGASPAPQKITLGAGDYGRPELRLVEDWSRKGVAVSVINALDHKSAALVVLILVVCVLFLFNAVSAAVRDRQRELATLACLGWPPRKLFQVLLGEVGLIGLAAGAAGAGLATALSSLASLSGPTWRVLLAIPVAVVLSLVAAVVPAARAARTNPGAGLHAIAVRARRTSGRRHRTVASLAFANLWRMPGRTILGAVSLAIGIAGATALLAVVRGFHGAVVGTLLGDAVSVQVREVDLIAVAAVLALGVAAVADVLYLNVRERAGEIATLRATGWSTAAVIRLIAWEGIGIGLIGAVLGTATGLAAIALITGNALTAATLTAAATGAGAAVVAALVAACVPAWTIGRSPITQNLGEE